MAIPLGQPEVNEVEVEAAVGAVAVSAAAGAVAADEEKVAVEVEVEKGMAAVLAACQRQVYQSQRLEPITRS